MAKARPSLRQGPLTKPVATLPAPKKPPPYPGLPGVTQRGSTTPGFLKIPETAQAPPGVTLAGGNAAAQAQAARDPFAPDEVYTGEQGVFGRRLTNTLSGIATDENQEAYDSGFALTRDPNETGPNGVITPGRVTGFTLDVTNPFSKASLLQRSYENARRATQGSFAARGHLYSGGRIAAQNSNNFRRDQSNDALRAAFQRFISQSAARRSGAHDQYDVDTLASRGRLRDRNAASAV